MDPMEIFKYILKRINDTKKSPRDYVLNPEELVRIWWYLDEIKILTLEKEQYDYNMSYYNNRIKYVIGNMGYVHYVQREEGLTDDTDIFNRIVELRTLYDIWFQNEILKENPSLRDWFIE